VSSRKTTLQGSNLEVIQCLTGLKVLSRVSGLQQDILNQGKGRLKAIQGGRRDARGRRVTRSNPVVVMVVRLDNKVLLDNKVVRLSDIPNNNSLERAASR